LCLYYGGGGGSRTRVQKHIRKIFSERSRVSYFAPIKTGDRLKQHYLRKVFQKTPEKMPFEYPALFDALKYHAGMIIQNIAALTLQKLIFRF